MSSYNVGYCPHSSQIGLGIVAAYNASTATYVQNYRNEQIKFYF